MMMKARNRIPGFTSSNTLSYPSSFTNTDVLLGTVSKPANFVAGTITLTLRAYGGKTNANTMESGTYVNDVNGTRLITAYVGDRANNSTTFDITDTATVSLTDAQFPLTVRSWVWYGGWYVYGVTAVVTIASPDIASGTTFQYSSTYWTDATTTLNTGSTDRTTADAKFAVMNQAPIKDVLALWPDVGFTGGSISQSESWTWLVNNYYYGGARATPLLGFSSTTSRDATTHFLNTSDQTSFAGYSSSIWSQQSGAKRHVFGGGIHLSANASTRWGFIWNNENDFATVDVTGGIGMSHGSYSAGDYYGGAGTQVLNRSMRVEMYGR